MLLNLFKMCIFHVFSVCIWWMMQCLSSFKISKYMYNLNENHQIKFNLWFHSWHWLIFRIIHNWPKFYLDLYCVTVLQIFRQNAQIEHFSYAYMYLPSVRRKKARWSDWILYATFISNWPSRSGRYENYNTDNELQRTDFDLKSSLKVRGNGTPPLLDVLPIKINNENFFLSIVFIFTKYDNFPRSSVRLRID